MSILYLYKYLFKGSDATKYFLNKYKRLHPGEINEIMEYRIARYLSSIEAAMKILKFHIYITTPSVECLNVHLPIAGDWQLPVTILSATPSHGCRAYGAADDATLIMLRV